MFVNATCSFVAQGGSVMSKVCEVCGKHPVAGRSISHSHRVTNRKFRPNIQRVYVVVDGHRRKMNVCSTCLKSGKVARS
ncbi:ribosomal protein L28 [Collinsella aerofaciens ATCC 25986]|uniref:Large ribosomal subunit protein bL28 n=3 Tax=Collinsella aerofaciens TaxID=74426 RepID=A4ECL2_COLAA|nr:ribosomal protein L28 [Collinsella aerofaciens ATCC 25986]